MNALCSISTALALSLTLFACKQQEEVQLPSPRPVLVYEVKTSSVGGGSTYAGEVKARLETALSFRLAGKLIERKVDVGATVRAGQVLARIDRADPALAAQAALSQQAAIAAEVDLARAEVQRFESLRGKNFVSQSALDARLSSLKAAENRWAAARSQAEVAGHQANYTDLLAETSGVVLAVLAEVGQVVSAGQPILRLAGNSEKEIAISVAENRVGELSSAREFSVRLWADSERSYRGKLREVSPQADPVTRTYAARIALIDADAEVRLGMTATVALVGKSEATILVPTSSVVQKDGQAAVWVLGEGGVITLRKVNVVAWREDGAQLKEGLRIGERIVAAGGHKLMPGEKVRVLETR